MQKKDQKVKLESIKILIKETGGYEEKHRFHRVGKEVNMIKISKINIR